MQDYHTSYLNDLLKILKYSKQLNKLSNQTSEINRTKIIQYYDEYNYTETIKICLK